MESLVEAFSRLRVVLVEPTYDGNLGQVARAMSNFGLTRLQLVGGAADPASDEARWYARDEAQKVLELAVRHDTLRGALADCKTVIATSRRRGRNRGPVELPEELFPRLKPWKLPWETALVFGREAHGLSTAEVDLCQHLVWIPSDPAHPSLNLAHATAVIGYALARAARGDLGAEPEKEVVIPADREAVEAMFQHARRVWVRIGYLHYQNPDVILRAWRKLFARTGLTQRDVRVVRALLHQTEWVARVAGIPPGGPEEAPPELFDKHAPMGDLGGED